MRTVFAICLALSGCHSPRVRCAASLPTELEVHADGRAFAIKPAPEAGTLDVCDGAGQWLGAARVEPGALTLRDAKGTTVLELRRDGDEVARGAGPGGPRLRLFHRGAEWRVLRPDGVPLGSVTTDAQGATVYSPAGIALSKVERTVEAAGDGQAVRSLAGDALQARVVPSHAPGPAGTLALDGLSPEERLAIYLYWSR
jgi:hypothetical protein